VSKIHLPKDWPLVAIHLYRLHEAALQRRIKDADRQLYELREFFLFQREKGLSFRQFPQPALNEYLARLTDCKREALLRALTPWLKRLKKAGWIALLDVPQLPSHSRRTRRMVHNDLEAPWFWPGSAKRLYREYRKNLQQRLTDCRKYLGFLHHFFPEQHKQGLSFRDFPRSFVYAYLDGLKPSMRPTFLTALRDWLRFLYRRQELLLALHEELGEYQTRKPSRRSILGHDQVLAVMAQPDLETVEGIRDRAFLELAYSTGLRLSELLQLDLVTLDLGAALVRVQKTKNTHSRNVPLTSWAVHYLSLYLSEARPQLASPLSLNALWLNLRGKRWSRYDVITHLPKTYRWRETVGFHFTMHLMRHAFATHLLTAGAPLRHVQELLGHCCISNTAIYTHITPVELQAQIRRCHPRNQTGFFGEQG
jgi:integrase/recombinase XerD